VPEASLDNFRKLRPGAERRIPAALRRSISKCRFALAGLLWPCLSLEPAGLRAGPPVVVPVPAAKPVPAVVHITDGQDRMMSGQLRPAAEKRSQANALYAQAMLRADDAAVGQPSVTDLFSQVVKLDPSFIDAQIRLVNLYLQAGQVDRAMTQIRSAAAENPDSIPVQAALGFTLRLRGENDEARRLSTHVLLRDPTQSLAMRVLLEVASDDNDLAGGVLHIEDILTAGGAAVPASAWMDLARLYQEIAQGAVRPPGGDVILRTRLPMLREAATKPPASIETLKLLSDTCRDLGRKDEALSALQQAAALDPSQVDILLHCADLESDLGRNAEALATYEKVYALNPDLPILRGLLGDLYLTSSRYADAIPLFEAALAQSPQDAGLNIDLGIAYEGAHHPDQAQACFERVFGAVACPPEAYLKLAFFQLDHDETKQAGRTLDHALARFPQSAEIHFCQAVRYRHEKNYPAAVDSLAQARALAIGPDAGALDPYFYLESATILSLAGRRDQFEMTLQEGLHKYPDNPEIMNELAYFWADERSHLPEALALSRRAATLDPENGPIEDTRGWVYFQMGQPKDALPYLQRAAFMTNNDPVVLQHVGDAYLKLGLRREAIATWTRALEKDPRNGDLTNRIDAALAQAKNAHLRSAPTP
jgi:tetratricopeptide (TPR) repeat protein